jgi:hypothetical protein
MAEETARVTVLSNPIGADGADALKPSSRTPTSVRYSASRRR